ncbi:MAG: site-specific DNA-methyltransferase [Candidatus Eisenbacteria bacterium]|nr:site-specific DNA-methyltransferase [Candidatus Eisenbacteria bacterium]
MTTIHTVHRGDASRMSTIPDASIDLMVTSPPYPMIEMWDGMFADLDENIRIALADHDAAGAFRLMHARLDAVWAEVSRVLKPGGIACINIGDATRTVAGDFRLYSNHSRVLSSLESLGLVALPDILWRKQTNAPNKFLGSGVLPAGAYVTLEHEYILIARKGRRRAFASEGERQRRRASSFFWEERNVWFSDVWLDVQGTAQDLEIRESRKRSAAYPLEIPCRLINMFSVKGDMVLDPFLGTGTTAIAALATARNSIGYELDAPLCRIAETVLLEAIPAARSYIEERVRAHVEFIARRSQAGGFFGHRNRHYDFEVVTEPETDLVLDLPSEVRDAGHGRFEATYAAEILPAALPSWKAQALPAPPPVPCEGNRGLRDALRAESPLNTEEL